MSEPAEKLTDYLPLSPDHNAERLATLKQLFPDLFTNEGRLNVDELKKVVDPTLVSETERYDFRWYGKTASKREAFTPSRAALVYDKARSVNPEKAGGNMIIEGENLEVLKLLSSAYRERIKCIYIDPPYNTGKDFVYSDRFAEGQKPYWEQTGVTEDGVKVDSNTDSDGRFHSNWLSMMHSRLLVARYLLKPDGVIFVSIDDNEVQNMRRVMDEVFGEECFIASIVWRRTVSGAVSGRNVVVSHDYILCYARTDGAELNRLEVADEAAYKNPDEDVRGPYKLQKLERTLEGARPTMTFEIQTPNGPLLKTWAVSPETFQELLADNRIAFSRSGQPYYKQFLSEYKGRLPDTWWDETGGFNQDGARELKNLLGEKDLFTNPKPPELLETILKIASQQDSLILDFFGGSGTTAQAVMELNKADGGNRQFILVHSQN